MNRSSDVVLTDQRGAGFAIKAMSITAMAAGMGWGIRGQYGHETGAMIAGVLASLTLILLFVPRASSLMAARAAAMMTVGIGIGGTMTYGQTIGLTQDKDLVGNWEALRWGLLGLFIKGGIWIGFAGAFLGMGLSGVRYRSLEILALLLGLIGLVFAGQWLINSPFDPTNKILPRFYFSGSWYFQPHKLDLKPRGEIWGGLLTALAGLVVYGYAIRRDVLACRMAWIGFIAGGLGFSGGQCIQAFHSWNAELFTKGYLSHFTIFTYFNWWNMMETCFGFVFGAILALGLWLNRSRIAIDQLEPDVSMSPTWEAALLMVHLVLLLSSEFLRLPGYAAWIGSYTNYGLIMCVIPLVGIVGGRFWPYLLLLPVVAAPICGKEMRALIYNESPQYSISVGWMIFVMIPMAITLVSSVWVISKSTGQSNARGFAAYALLLSTWLYFGLNTYFFQFAWPWNDWTTRTPNQAIFGFCTVCLTITAIVQWYRSSKESISLNPLN